MIKGKLNLMFTTLISVLLFIQFSCKTQPPSDLSKESIIPRPVSIKSTGEYFTLKTGSKIYIQGESIEAMKTGQFLADVLNPSTGFGIEVKTTKETPTSGNIYLTFSGTDANLGEEGYELVINKNMLKLAANTPAGLFHGIQTIRQILPSNIEQPVKQQGPWRIPTGTIIDYPSFSYRGAMLDVARHFFVSDDVKRFIDLLAYYKINYLHLHLSDDQGWRIEIKSWPNLTIHGGSTQVGGGKGGYYTQEQYTDIVRYAKERFITIVPEIDMPGHINAALASYAELNCNGKATDLYTGIEVGFSTLCTKKEITYKFINDVMKELAALTPGPYIHIGGDESHATKKEDYIPFVKKVQDIVILNGKRAIGWDDIATAGLKAGSIAQYWANVKNATDAVNQGAKLILSPAKKAYVDMKYDSTTKLGQNWAAYIEVDSAYIWDPSTIIPGVGKDKILGIEPALWTEKITNMDEIEYMVFPRLPGYAEIGWTPSSYRNWSEYRERLGKHGDRLKILGVDYYRSKLVPWNK